MIRSSFTPLLLLSLLLTNSKECVSFSPVLHSKPKNQNQNRHPIFLQATQHHILKSHDNEDDETENNSRMIDRRSAIVGVGVTSLLFVNPSISNAAATAGPGFLQSRRITKQPSAANANANNKASTSIPEWTLDGDVKFPVLALNTVGLSVDETTRAVEYAVQYGIKHVDFHPGKERDGVAQYLKKNKNARDSLFLNTKIRKAKPGTSASEAAFLAQSQIDEDLKILGVKSVDMLMLRDSPDCDVIQAQWKVLEQNLEAGKTRSIGVINFCEKALTCVLQTAKVKPAINYYMLHVGMGPDPKGLKSFSEKNGIRTFAYGAVGEPGPNLEILESNVLKEIGKAHNSKSPEEVALRWVLQNENAVSVRPTTSFGLGTSICDGDGSCEDGLKKRAQSFQWELSQKEMDTLNALTSPDDNPTLFSSSGCPNAFVMPK